MNFPQLLTTLSPVLPLFAILTLGLLLGKVRIAGLSLDSAAVVFVGLVFGALGAQIPPIFQTLGLVLFVFSVGMQSGPGFLASFTRGGLRLIVPAALMILASVGVMFAAAALLNLDLRLALGLLTGGRSSNSALAVGVESTASGLPALGHSLAYPVAILSILLLVRFLPTLFRADLAQEERALLRLHALDHPPVETRTYRVENPNLAGKPLAELHVNRLTGVNLSRIFQQGQIRLPEPRLVLQAGDLVKAVGTLENQANAALLLGPEVNAGEFPDLAPGTSNEVRWMVIGAKNVVHQTLEGLALRETYGATITRLQRNGIEISPQGSTVLRWADRVLVVADRQHVEALRAHLGDHQRPVDKDFLPLFLIIFLGLVLGSFSVGLTGGVLLASLGLSALGKTGPVLWVVSESTNRFVRQLGLLLFLGAVGTKAGAEILGLLTLQGLGLLGASVAIAVVPLVLMAWACRAVLKMNMLTLMGLVAGSTTCSPALAASQAASQSGASQLAYATVYPFAMIFMMVCAQAITLLF